MRPPAKIGVMVESAPQDRKRLFPKKANANEPARKAKNPISGENPPSRAVAICSGIAMAARVRPATRSHVKNRGRYESRERWCRGRVAARGSCAAGIGESHKRGRPRALGCERILLSAPTRGRYSTGRCVFVRFPDDRRLAVIVRFVEN